MGGRRSSSKTKSSRKKREKIISKKTSRKKESKRYRHDSVSSYSDDDSVSPQRLTKSSRSKSDYRTRKTKNKKLLSSHLDNLSVSSDSDYSSSSDKAHKHRKVRSARVRLTSSKKRARKRLPSPDNNADYNARKRKSSDKGHILDARKKSSKKKLKKYSSDSSISDSESCSTCSNSDDNRKRRQVILDDDIGSPRGRESYSNKKKRRVRSPSCSSCEKNVDLNGGETHHDKAVFPETKSRRLRSVIAVPCESHDEMETRLENDFHKEEIVYDQDDYPSSKSLDSDHDRSKMGSDSHFHGTYDQRIHAGSVAENIKSGTSEGYLSNTNYHNSERASVRDFDEEKGKGDSVPVSAAGANDLESMLRQRALENLSKYRKEFKTGQKSNNMIMAYEHGANCSVPKGPDGDDEENKSTMQDVSNAHELKQPSDALLRREISERIELQKLRDCERIKESEMTKQTVENPANQPSLLGCSVAKRANNEQIKSSEGGASKAHELKLTSGALLKRVTSEIVEVPKLPDSEQIKKDPEMDKQTVENPTPLGFSEGGNVASSHASLEKPVSRSDTNSEALFLNKRTNSEARPTNNAGSSSIMGPSSVGPMSQEHNLGQQNEAEDASQFKQKTISVMRGGEMVEVSYKVYIPKRPPALARRQLRK